MQTAFFVLGRSLSFYMTHSVPILGLALFAAAGRMIQFGWSNGMVRLLR